MLTVCALFYGPEQLSEPQLLAQRCLDGFLGLQDFSTVEEFRFGLNEAGPTLTKIVVEAARELQKTRPVRLFVCKEKGRKYPMMRRMFYGPGLPEPDKIAWFDDDSYLTEPTGLALHHLNSALEIAEGVAVAGWRAYTWLRRGQAEWITQQPWYRGQTFPARRPHKVQFALGGFWGSHWRFLKKHDYPFPAIRSQGGDYMLGELCRQMGVHVEDVRVGVNVNASLSGETHKMPRRGDVHVPVGAEGYDPADLSHQEIEVQQYDPSELV